MLKTCTLLLVAIYLFAGCLTPAVAAEEFHGSLVIPGCYELYTFPGIDIVLEESGAGLIDAPWAAFPLPVVWSQWGSEIDIVAAGAVLNMRRINDTLVPQTAPVAFCGYAEPIPSPACPDISGLQDTIVAQAQEVGTLRVQVLGLSGDLADVCLAYQADTGMIHAACP